jgi:hypothetical protein
VVNVAEPSAEGNLRFRVHPHTAEYENPVVLQGAQDHLSEPIIRSECVRFHADDLGAN